MITKMSTNKKRSEKSFLVIGILIAVFCFFAVVPHLLQADVYDQYRRDIGDLAKSTITGGEVIREKQVIEINQSLKNLIEENQHLAKNNSNLSDEIERLRDETMIERNRYQELKSQKEQLAKRIENVTKVNRQYAKKIKTLESEIHASAYEKPTHEFQLARAKGQSAMPRSLDSSLDVKEIKTKEIVDREEKTLDILAKIDAFAEEDELLRTDAAKAHYNIGNIYFQKGEYEIAFREYYQAVTLMPDDADAHYNLAFVSEEYLKDYQTALKHYRMYLFLKPEAKDAHLVRGKIKKAKLNLESFVDSPLDEPETKEK